MIDKKDWTDKDSKKPEYAELYEKHDFIKAYSLHKIGKFTADGSLNFYNNKA